MANTARDSDDARTARTATTKDEAEALIAELEAGDEVLLDDERHRVLDTWLGGHNDETPKAKVKRVDAYSHGNREIMASGFRHNCVAERARGMGAHWSTIELLADEEEDSEDDEPEDDGDDEGEQAEEELVADGGVATADGGDAEPLAREEQPAEHSPHVHRTTWSAAAALEEDGEENPRIGVVYRAKNGGGRKRYAGEVDRVFAHRADDPSKPPVLKIHFHRDDGQMMWLDGDQLHTRRAHATYVGTVERITTSTAYEQELPEPPEDAVSLAAVRGAQEWREQGPGRRARIDALDHALAELEELVGEDEAHNRAADLADELAERADWD